MADAFAPGAHEHVFLGEDHERNEKRVWLVIGLTAAMMVAEITAGSIYGSMALIADGWHMSTHAGAMLIAALAYGYARRQARNPQFTFGTGKLGDLAAFASAIVLALVALLIGWESFLRFTNPVEISFTQAIAVGVIGLAVNLVCAWLLKDDHAHHGHAHGHAHGHSQGVKAHSHAEHDHPHPHKHDHGHDHGHDHPHPHAHPHDHGHDHAHRDHAHPHDHDHDDHHGHAHPHPHPHEPARAAVGARDNNLKAAYLHVLADALTSVLAIVALVLGSFNGWLWADPLMGIVGALVIGRWSWGLIRASGNILLDRIPVDEELPGEIRDALETEGDRITDLHVWQVGPGHHSAIVALTSPAPQPPSHYKARLAHLHELSHLTVEVEPAGAR
jgi:cation diffusion facilitator family transporter